MIHEGREVKGIGYNRIIITCRICNKIFIPEYLLETCYNFWKNNHGRKAFCKIHMEEGMRVVSNEQTQKNIKWDKIEGERRKLR